MIKIETTILKSNARCVVAHTVASQETPDGNITNRHTNFYIVNDDPESQTAIFKIAFWHNPSSSDPTTPGAAFSIGAIPRKAGDSLCRTHYSLPRIGNNSSAEAEALHLSRLLNRNCNEDVAYTDDWSIFNPKQDQRAYNELLSKFSSVREMTFKIGAQCKQDLLAIWDIIGTAIEQNDGQVLVSQLDAIGNDPEPKQRTFT